MKRESTSATRKLMLAFSFALGLAVVLTPQAHAQTFSVIHNFTGGTDGGDPINGFLVSGKTLYGTASAGGTFNYGVVFKLSAAGTETVLHNFGSGTDGQTPQGSLVRDKSGNFYGTTTAGGNYGFGTVYKVTGKKETVLYSFAGGNDGANPQAGLVFDASGNLYGTTSQGGSKGNGTVFELVAPKILGGSYTEKLLYSFGTGTDGTVPVGGVIFDTAGNLYGTTSAGGTYGYGTVFQLVPGTAWTENILHSFQDGNDGAVPMLALSPTRLGIYTGRPPRVVQTEAVPFSNLHSQMANGTSTPSTAFRGGGFREASVMSF